MKLEERALTSEVLSKADFARLRQAIDEARARRMQPHYIELAFREAFTLLGGHLVRRERGRFEATNAAGFDEAKIRTVSENAKPLKFDQAGFEES